MNSIKKRVTKLKDREILVSDTVKHSEKLHKTHFVSVFKKLSDDVLERQISAFSPNHFCIKM